MVLFDPAVGLWASRSTAANRCGCPGEAPGALARVLATGAGGTEKRWERCVAV